jgi:hypothetical protein
MKRLKLLLACMLTLLLGTQVAVCVGDPPPSNDNCSNAELVGNVTNQPFDTTFATKDGPNACMNSPNIWYRYTATCTGCVTVSLRGSSYDTMLAVYDGASCPVTLGRLLQCNDDYTALDSQVTFAATASKQYLIEVGGMSGAIGPGVISISCDATSGQPDNDDCANAESIGNVSSLTFDTRCATFDGPGHVMRGSNIWYIYNAECSGNVIVSLCGSEYDTMLAVYNGSACYPTSQDIIDYNDDFCHWQSRVVFPATAGHDYLIEVGGYGAQAGHGVMSISCGEVPGPCPAPNDNCHNAKPVGNVTNLAFDTTCATFDGPGHAMTSANVWYLYTATCTGSATVSLCGSNFDTMLAIYHGGECYPTSGDLIEICDDFCDQQSELTIPTIAGNQYLIEVGGYGFETGQGVISISCEGVPGPTPPCPVPNDDCDNAKPVGNVTNLAFDTSCATFDGPSRCMISPNIWYRYTATCTGEVTVSLCGSSYDTMLAVYNGVNCYPTSARLIECNDDFCGWHSQITFEAIAGNQYLIEVGGFGTDSGAGVLSISCEGEEIPEQFELGDAPDSSNSFASTQMTAYPKGGPPGRRARYPTVYAAGSPPHGPIHSNPLAVAHLGKKVTHESEADTGLDQDGVNNINPPGDSPDNDAGDDGVIFPLNLPHCRWATFDYNVTVINPGTDLWVNVWFDWNRDGDWDDTLDCTDVPTPEWAVQNQYLFNLPAGLHKITTPAFLSWHPEVWPKQIWMRITLSEQPWKGGENPEMRGNGGSGPEGGYEIGETEDYYFRPDTSYTICEDLNGDGVIKMDDLTLFVAEWLESCQ